MKILKKPEKTRKNPLFGGFFQGGSFRVFSGGFFRAGFFTANPAYNSRSSEDT